VLVLSQASGTPHSWSRRDTGAFPWWIRKRPEPTLNRGMPEASELADPPQEYFLKQCRSRLSLPGRF
jgi:hypothetical protein